MGLVTEPGATFARLLARPRWVWPLLFGLVVALAFMGIWLSKIDPVQLAQIAIDENPFVGQMTPEARAEAVQRSAPSLKRQYLIGMLIGYPSFVFLLGGLFLFVYRFVYGAELRYAESLTVISWSFLIASLVAMPLALGTMALKGEWNVDLQNAFQANLSLLLPQESTSKPLYSFAQEIDLLAFWKIFLLSCGFGVATRKTTSAALWGVGVLWAIYVLIKVGFVALMS
jgi:hypothetical protein